MKSAIAGVSSKLASSTQITAVRHALPKLTRVISRRNYTSQTPTPLAYAQSVPKIDSFVPMGLKTPSRPSYFYQLSPSPSYSIVSAVAGIAKRPGKVDSNASSIGSGFGEDSYFFRRDALGIADGVGGWKFNSGNSEYYSRRLMHYANLELSKYDDIDADEFINYDQADPVNVLAKSYDRTNFDAYIEQVKGSSTALLALLRDNTLRVANLGDCGLAVIRQGEYIFRTEEQQHAFNYPYQLGIVGGDNPLSSQRFTIQVQKGDIVLLGTDGLFDNLYDDDILDTIQSQIKLHEVGPATTRFDIRPQRIADALANHARDIAENSRSASSPFGERANVEGLYHQGGKLDDITVLIGVVWDAEDSPDRR